MINIAMESLEQRTLSRFQRDGQARDESLLPRCPCHGTAAPGCSNAAEVQAQARANPSSLHQDGIAAPDALERARFQIVSRSALPDELVFTSSATESVHLASGLAGRQATEAADFAVEHPAVAGAAQQLSHQGWDVQEWLVDLSRIHLT